MANNCEYYSNKEIDMPLAEILPGERCLVVRIALQDAKLRKHLEDLGIITGAALTALSYSDGNVIVRVCDSRIALNGDVARSIIVSKRSA